MYLTLRKEVKTMKYEKPEVVELKAAIYAVQSGKQPGGDDPAQDNSPAYEDWE